MLQVTVNDKNTFSIEQEGEGLVIDGIAADWDVSSQANGLVSVLYNGKSYTAIIEQIDRATKEITVSINGQVYKTAIKEPIDLLLSNMGLDLKAMKKAEPIKAPMPGMVLKVLVAPGQQINKGDGLIILEAMKMENIIKATTTAVVKAVKVSERTTVEKGMVMIELE